MVNKVMNLVLFDDCLDHLVRVHRLMRLPRGNALLVGVGGSGKQSLTRLAAFISSMSVVQLKLTASYGMGDFKLDMISLYQGSGVKGQSIVFLFTDSFRVVSDSVCGERLQNGVFPDGL